MKTLLLVIGFAPTMLFALRAANDPVRDYIDTFSPLGGDRVFYLDDRVLRLDLDLNNDGTKEMFLSMARDRNGKQGNVWAIYQVTEADYRRIGGATFSPGRFYLGEIESLGRYGLVTFGPAGGGEGIIWAYMLNGSNVQQIKVGEVTRDQATAKLKGRELLEKYMGAEGISGDRVITAVDATHLAREYGITVEPKTYVQAVREGLPGSTPVKVPPTPTTTGSVAQSALPPATPTPALVEKSPPASTGSPAPAAETKPVSFGFPVVAVAIIASVIVGILGFLFRRKVS